VETRYQQQKQNIIMAKLPKPDAEMLTKEQWRERVLEFAMKHGLNKTNDHFRCWLIGAMTKERGRLARIVAKQKNAQNLTQSLDCGQPSPTIKGVKTND